MLGGVNSVSSQITSIYQTNNSLLAESLSKIASGKKINRPSDDFTGYVRSMNINQDIRGYESVKQDLVEAKAVADIASNAGNSIYEDLTRMKELAGMYTSASSDDQAAYAAEFDALKSAITSTISNANYNGTSLVAAGDAISVNTDPDGNGTFDVNFVADDVVDVSALSISNGTAAVQTELDTATTYLVKAESYSDQATRWVDMTDTVIQSKKSVMSMITDIDEAEELSNAISLSIRQQASVSMLGQSNMAQQAIMKLYM